MHSRIRSKRARGFADRSTLAFWALITVLVAASVFYGMRAEKQRRNVQSASGTIDNGDLVQLIKIIDGDSVLVAREGLEPVTVRLVGIKSFDAKVEKDATSSIAQEAVEALHRDMAGRPLRVQLNTPPKDRYGRVLATLYAREDDVALHLVREGRVFVYTVYPFPSLQIYLQEQQTARANHRGLWGNAAATKRALAMIRAMREERQ